MEKRKGLYWFCLRLKWKHEFLEMGEEREKLGTSGLFEVGGGGGGGGGLGWLILGGEF